jgi:hypothetical protein
MLMTAGNLVPNGQLNAEGAQAKIRFDTDFEAAKKAESRVSFPKLVKATSL